MKPFEIPYNFDPKLIYALKALQIDEYCIHCIYLSPVQSDYNAATRGTNTIKQLDTIDHGLYAEHVKLINKEFPNKTQLLLQSNDKIMQGKTLDYYLELGFTKFCVGSYAQAKILRDINKDFEIFGSITMKVQPQDLIIHPEYKDVFNGFILFWNYNRDFDLMKQLPRDYKYVLLVNCFCNQNCQGSHHWFMSPDKFLNNELKCPNYKYSNNGLSVPWNESGLIRPQDLPLFNPYIDVYKIQGREYPTGMIIQDFLNYMGDNSKSFAMFDNTMLPDINLYRKKTN